MDKNVEVEITASEKYEHDFCNWEAHGKERTDLAEQRSTEANERQADSHLYQVPPGHSGLAFSPLAPHHPCA